MVAPNLCEEVECLVKLPEHSLRAHEAAETVNVDVALPLTLDSITTSRVSYIYEKISLSSAYFDNSKDV